jgi:hypothetical protein
VHNIPESLVIEVPIELKKHFTEDSVNALRDLGGISTHTSSNFISSIEAINESLCLTNCVSKPIIELDMNDQEDTLMKYIQHGDGNLVKGVNYWVSLDLSLSKDRTGIAFTRVAGTTELERFDRSDGTNKLFQDNIYQTDLLIALKNKANQQIPLYKLEAFLLEMSQAGYQIAGISFDQFQSADLMQRLTNLGYNVEYISVDRDRRAYDTFRLVLLERRIRLPNHFILRKELLQLVDRGTKIDHPEQVAINKSEETRPSKDLTDAIAASLWQCIEKGEKDSKAFIALKSYSSYLRQQEMGSSGERDQLKKMMIALKVERDRKNYWGPSPANWTGSFGSFH